VLACPWRYLDAARATVASAARDWQVLTCTSFGGVFAVIGDDVFRVECVVRFKRFVCPKAVDMDGQRLLLAD